MAQRALTLDSQTARAGNGLLERAARVSGSPGTVASIGFPALSPTWGGSLGQHCSGSCPIVLQKGLYQSTLDAALSLLLDSRPQRRTLTTLRDSGLVTWGDLTRHATGKPRQWLPMHIIALMLTFPAEPPMQSQPNDRHRSSHLATHTFARRTARAHPHIRLRGPGTPPRDRLSPTTLQVGELPYGHLGPVPGLSPPS